MGFVARPSPRPSPKGRGSYLQIFGAPLKKTGLAYSADVSLECWESCERTDGSRPSEEKAQVGSSDAALLDLPARRWLSVIELASKGLSILPVEVNQ